MSLTVRQQKSFVCPDVPPDSKQKSDAFARATAGLKIPPVKKQPQAKIPRGGSRGRIKVR